MQIRAWLAIVAMALQALWPLLAQAKPASVVLVPVCTVDGVTHYIELPGGKTPLEQKTTDHKQHCSFCFFGAERFGLAPVVPALFVASGAFYLSSPVSSSPEPKEVSFLRAEARAPPVLPLVQLNYDEHGRTNEKAFAC